MLGAKFKSRLRPVCQCLNLPPSQEIVYKVTLSQYLMSTHSYFLSDIESQCVFVSDLQ